MSWDPSFEVAFNPQAVAVVGASGTSSKSGTRVGRGTQFVDSLQELGFAGRIYPVNPNTTEVRGLKAYPRVTDIPEPVDLVIVSVPAQHVEVVLEDCIAAGAKNVHIFTAGFEETGEDERAELGKRVREVAQRGSLRVIGPNCMGLYVPAARIGFANGQSTESGPVAMVAQSGGHCNWFSHYGKDYGIRFSKAISYGNAYVLDSTDFLEYLKADPETQIICMYLEGVKDGRKLLTQVKEINKTKPVLLWKGGLTEYGARAVASHTGKLAGEEALWRAFFKQTGAVRVDSLEEMADIAMTFLYVTLPAGRRVAVIGSGGGNSVAYADLCTRDGLEVPALTAETQRQLRSFIRVEGMSIRNPLDVGPVIDKAENFQKVIELVAADPRIDLIIAMPDIDRLLEIGQEEVNKLTRYLCDFRSSGLSSKPLVAVFFSRTNNPQAEAEQARLEVVLPRAGFAVYRSLARASRALSRFAEYHRLQREEANLSEMITASRSE